MPDATFRVQANPAGGSIAYIVTHGQNWRVRQVTNNVPNASGLASLKKNGAQITPMIASNGSAFQDPPVDIYRADRLTVEWSTAGLVGEILVIYDLL